jgi:integrase
MLCSLRLQVARVAPTVEIITKQYRLEKMPKRYSTSRVYEVWLRNYILPRWGSTSILEIRAHAADKWLESLALSPKSRSHIRGLLHRLWSFAMYAELIPIQVNPIELVEVPDASKRQRNPHNFTVPEFRKFIASLKNPYRMIAVLQICVGLRISEALALKWQDIDWLNRELNIERSIVRNRVDECKTSNSARKMPIGEELLAALEAWRQESQFTAPEDWVFASPAQLGRLPWSYDSVQRQFLEAGCGIENVGTHSMRHTFRTWLNDADTSTTVQQAMMRHADIRTTMSYGKTNEAAMKQAHQKVANMALIPK